MTRIPKDPMNITPAQVQRAIDHAWSLWSRYESRDNPYDEKGTEMYSEYLKARELAEGLEFFAPWLYPTGLP